MPRKPRRPPAANHSNYVDVRQVAGLLGLSGPTAVTVYRARYDDFPEPVLPHHELPTTGHALYWWKPEIEYWRAVHPGYRTRQAKTDNDEEPETRENKPDPDR